MWTDLFRERWYLFFACMNKPEYSTLRIVLDHALSATRSSFVVAASNDDQQTGSSGRHSGNFPGHLRRCFKCHRASLGGGSPHGTPILLGEGRDDSSPFPIHIPSRPSCPRRHGGRRKMWLIMEETTVVLSQGDFFLQDGAVQQRLDRCQGELWTYVWNDGAFPDRSLLSLRLSGKAIFWLSRLLRLCGLILVWNDDFTRAELSIEGKPFLFGTSYTGMEMLPFWAWKFGLEHEEDTSTLQAMDSKCCPLKENGPDCTGGGVLGTLGHPCETISMACGPIDRDDIVNCAMWRRSGPTFFGFFEYTYLGYPIGDKYQQPTGFFPRFEEAMEENGVRQFFQGHQTESCPQESTGT